MPAVIIENATIEQKNYHNSHYAGSEYDGNGNVTAEIFRHYYELRLELVIRDNDEPQAFGYLGDVQKALSELGRDPGGKIHDHVNEVKSLGSGGVSYQFYEPTETEINQSVLLTTFYETENSDPDVIDSISTDKIFS